MRILVAYVNQLATAWCPLCRAMIKYGNIDPHSYIENNVHIWCSNCNLTAFTCSDLDEDYYSQLNEDNIIENSSDKCLQWLTREEAEMYSQNHDYDWSAFLSDFPDVPNPTKWERKFFYLTGLVTITHLERLDVDDTSLGPETKTLTLDPENPDKLWAELKAPTINLGDFTWNFLEQHGWGCSLGFRGQCSECGKNVENSLGAD